MSAARVVSGKVVLQCSSGRCKHGWDEGYSVAADENGNPDVGLLNHFLEKRKIKCPLCGYISFKILKIVVSAVHS